MGQPCRAPTTKDSEDARTISRGNYRCERRGRGNYLHRPSTSMTHFSSGQRGDESVGEGLESRWILHATVSVDGPRNAAAISCARDGKQPKRQLASEIVNLLRTMKPKQFPKSRLNSQLSVRAGHRCGRWKESSCGRNRAKFLYDSLIQNTSSTLFSKRRDTLRAKASEGVYAPASRATIVCLVTPTWSASVCCVMPSSATRSSLMQLSRSGSRLRGTVLPPVSKDGD